MKRAVCLVLAASLLLCGCAMTREEEHEYMAAASAELMSIQWDVDYADFTSERTTAFAKKYYDSEFLADYLEDPELSAGVDAVTVERLSCRLISAEATGYSTQRLGEAGAEIDYEVCHMRTVMYIDSYEPLYPEDSFFEAGREYTLLYDVYFMREDGRLKLSAFEFEPEGEAFLPKRAENVTLGETQRAQIEEVARQYYQYRYAFNYRDYDGQEVYDFYLKHMTERQREREGITEEYFDALKEELTAFSLTVRLTSLSLDVPGDKSGIVVDEESVEYYYIVEAAVSFLPTGAAEYFEQTGMTEGEGVSFTEKLCFLFEEGEPVIAYSEYGE